MDDVHALEEGLLTAAVASAGGVAPPRGSVVARDWALELQLRPGQALGPRATALVPVVRAWAEARGWTAPGFREIGTGLAWVGLRRRLVSGYGKGRDRHVALHPEDSTRLWALVRAAWAPAYAPGDARARSARKAREAKERRARLGPAPRVKPPPLPLFHEELLKLGRKARPLVDSLGRVWPSGCVAARALGGSCKAVDNARRLLADALTGTPRESTSARILAAMRRGGSWRGVWWRHLTPAEVKAVPLEHRSGEALPGLGWGLVCPKCSACGVSKE